MVTRLPVTGTKIASPVRNRTSLELSPSSRKRYRSTSATAFPDRISRIPLILPLSVGPPAKKRALNNDVSDDTVYAPGRLTSPVR